MRVTRLIAQGVPSHKSDQSLRSCRLASLGHLRPGQYFLRSRLTRAGREIKRELRSKTLLLEPAAGTPPQRPARLEDGPALPVARYQARSAIV